MLRCFVLEFGGSRERYLPLVEFAYNNSYQSSIRMVPYEALYGRKCRTPLYWTGLSEKQIHGVDLVKETKEKSKSCFRLTKVVCGFEKKRNRVSSGRQGPYEVTARIGPVAYWLALLVELEKIHNVFHASVLRQYRSDPLHVIPLSERRYNRT
ncbi:Retrotransposon protein, Ty3-gypsy subclass [Gossypium australe]|uniref:Retrotransposon protein, Ty3-gypsy subclass n=1 Tax=Gossypium australe TaxID=47621 RepID=A0A5B6WSJ5_9ROSI|nr:Retrotransposon protein, Ty3-gypsy subclass [Gossypium australe]